MQSMPTECYTSDFYRELRSGAARSAEVIVPLVTNLLRPASVVDVGCGDGTWLAVFLKLGAPEILGIDGDHVGPDLLQIPPGSFRAIDLTRSFNLDRTFDLAVSLEVAEHLPAECARAFVESLTRLAPAVLFSAAIPFQGGNHHVNEQWPDQWAAIFRGHGYLPVDCIRRRVWQNDDVEWWYAQNTLLFVQSTLLERNATLKAEAERTSGDQLRLVHPRNYLHARVPLDPPPWGVRAASRLFATCFARAFTRKVYSVLGKKVPVGVARNPPNYNAALQRRALHGISKGPSRD